MFPIYYATLEYPREVSMRTPSYYPVDGQELSKPVGFIPQVESTYAYWEGIYGYMNEHGLSLGESTAASNFPVSRVNLTALFWIRPLTQIAMERCRTAKCAVKIMGSLAEKHGFYGEDPGPAGGGECLILADGEEVWHFEITGDTTGKSAFWAAHRLQEGHVSMCANNFALRELDCEDEDNFQCSSNLLANVKASGYWDGAGVFDWGKSMGPDIRHFSYTAGYPPIPEYTTARVWRVFSRVAPSLGLTRNDNPWEFPFSVRAEWPITAHDLMDLKRDHYEGTDIDLTVGAFAGPFGSPNRIEGGTGLKILGELNGGYFARAISLARTSYCTVGQSFGQARKSLDKMWWASDTPASSVFVPFYANTSVYSQSYSTGTMKEYDEHSAWWVFTFVANWMDLNYRLISVDVKEKMLELQNVIESERQPLEEAVMASPHSESSIAKLEEFQQRIQDRVVKSWRDFGRFLVMKYNDGKINHPTIATPIGYPAWWLQMNGLDKDNRIKWAKPSDEPPTFWEFFGAGPFEVVPPKIQDFLAASLLATKAPDASSAVSVASYLLIFAAGLIIGRWRNRCTPTADAPSSYHAMPAQ